MKRNGKRVLFLIELREQKGREREREKYSPGSTERSGGGNRRLCCRTVFFFLSKNVLYTKEKTETKAKILFPEIPVKHKIKFKVTPRTFSSH